MATPAQAWVDEEAIIREKIAEVPLPAGVKFKALEPRVEWTGEDSWEITFTVSKKLPLTKALFKDLGVVRQALYDRIFALRFGKFPLIRFTEGR